jgi:two-component system, NtrC family, nitrogen regulation sensor histidine kinase NtrY
MMSKNLYFQIFFRVIIIAVTCGIVAYGYFKYNNFFIAIPGVFLVMIETGLLIQYLNKTNRRLAYFIDSIRNEDTSVQFPKDINNIAVSDLYNSLNFLNEKIRKTKVEIGYNEQLLKTFIEYSSTGFITIDENGDFEVLNHHARKFLGVEHTSNIYRLKQHDAQLYHTLKNILPGETKTHRIQRKDQLFVLSISIAEIKYYDKKFKIVSMQDISRELDEQELASWHKLFRVITHEIMNSIAPITSLSQKLTKYYKQDGAKKSPSDINEKTINDTLKGLKVIDDMSNGLMNFVRNYRQLSKIPKPNIGKIELRSWLSHLKTLILEMIKDKDIELKISVSNDCNVIFGDEKLLNQVMINLILNSIDAIRDSSKKEITIHLYLSPEGKTIVHVSDTGKGISEEDLEKVFVPFFTTKDDGNGIGLSLSKQIIKMHRGSMSIRSRLGEGTQVMVVL